MAKIKKAKPEKGKNIRFSEEAHRLLKKFADTNGYNLGSFCQLAAIEKMKTLINELTKGGKK